MTNISVSVHPISHHVEWSGWVAVSPVPFVPLPTRVLDRT